MCYLEPPPNGAPVAATPDTICSHLTDLFREVVPASAISGLKAVHIRLLRMTVCQHVAPFLVVWHRGNTCACGGCRPLAPPRACRPGPARRAVSTPKHSEALRSTPSLYRIGI